MNSGTGTCTKASEGTWGSPASVRFIHHIVGRSTHPLQMIGTPQPSCPTDAALSRTLQQGLGHLLLSLD